MKKIIGILSILVLMLFVFSCASKKATPGLTRDGRPQWVATMSQKPTEQLHFEVGYGKLSTFATSLKKAESDARNKIALWIKTDVNTVLKTYTQDSGIGDDRELIEYLEEVSVQTAKVSISGAEIEDSYEDAEGGVYVLMSFPIDNVGKSLDETLKAYNRSESAAFAEFKAQEAFRQLQAGY